MLSSLSASDVANEISMSRSSFKGTYLVVEGSTDIRLYGKFVSDGTRLIAACSKNNVAESVAELVRRGDTAVVGIVDRDMDTLLGKKCRAPVFQTDRRDMETMILCSDALGAVLSEYADREKLAAFEESNGPVRDVLGRSAASIGALMFISYRRGMNLSFKDLDFDGFVVRGSMGVDVRRMVTTVFSQSMDQMYTVRYISDQVRELTSKTDDPWEFARGHDAVSILALGLREVFGSYNASRLGDNALGGALRLAFGHEQFVSTDLYKATSEYSSEKGISLWSGSRALTPRRKAPS